jgi:cytochrome c oxidase cbb3-type subunit 3
MWLNTAIILALIVMSGGSMVLAQGGVHGNADRGLAVYEQHCLRCHGEKLDGHGPEASSLLHPPADLGALSSRTKSDWELLITVAHGVMYTSMHGFRNRLTEPQIRDVIAYIRSQAPYVN